MEFHGQKGDVALDLASPGAGQPQQTLATPAASGSPRVQHSGLRLSDVWRSLSTASKAVLLFGMSQSLIFTIFAATQLTSKVGP